MEFLWIVCITIILLADQALSHKSGNELDPQMLVELTNGNGIDGGSSSSIQDIVNLVFQPNVLDFHELSIGDANSNVVTVFNRHTNRSVYMGAISGHVPDFYSSFFEEKVIPPMGNTTFNVVFLPRQQGPIQSQLVIHTSFGAVNYTVRGKGVECLFRLNPLVGLRAPFNATLSPEIYMYNPFSTPLQIMEVYSSGGHFHLELPSGGQEAPQTLWEIPPYCSKPIIRVRFTASVPGNHTAYIRIKISSGNDSDLENVVLVVPIEVEITPDHGIYSKIPILNFGLAGNQDAPKKIVFKLFNSGVDPVQINTYAIEADPDVANGVSVIISNGHIDDGSFKVVTAEIDWSKVKTERYIKGNILITSLMNNREFEYKIPFVGELLHGSIGYNSTQTMFVANHVSAVTKDFILKNNFQSALAITNITMSGDFDHFFKISQFTARILNAGDETMLLKITQLPAITKEITIRQLIIHTNVTSYEITVTSYSGLLRRIVPVEKDTINGIGPDEKSINYGTLPLSTLTDTMLAFVNDNPLPISINNWKGTMSGVASIVIILRGCGNLTVDHLKYCIAIQPGEWIVFQISVLSNAVGSFIGNFYLKTDYEEISTPVRFTTAIGRVEFTAVMVKEDECFPGGVCSADITAHSTFSDRITVEEILVNVTGLTYDYINMKFPVIHPNELTHIGQFLLNPRPLCGEECYIEFPDKLSPLIISSNCKAIEKDLMNSKLEYYRLMKQSFQSISYQVKISQHKRYEFSGQANLQWPRLVHGTVEFPLVQVGSELIKYITVRNPSMHPVMAYYVLHDGISGTSMTFPPEIITSCWDCFLTRDNVFALADTNIKNQHFQYLPPKSSSQIAISFQSQLPGKYSTLLYIRNNFTIMEAIWLTAHAVVPQFKFGNRRPGSQTPLLFELSDKHLRDCDQMKAEGIPFVVTAKRTFTARNTGDVSIAVRNIFIGGQSCEGFGFKILNCTPFELEPNGSKKLEIGFTPDFTLARVTRVLEIETSLNFSINYTLLSMIPSQFLGPCSKALKRPRWELPLQHTLLGVFVTSFFLLIMVAYFDADKVLRDHVAQISKSKGPAQPALDLRKIGLRNPFFASGDNDSSTHTTTNSVKLNTTPPMSNGKRSERKRSDVPSESNKKSWATVLAKKFSPIKSDVKFRETTNNQTTTTQPPSKSPDQRKENGKKSKETVDFCDAIKRSEDDSSSTTTENSVQSIEPDHKPSGSKLKKASIVGVESVEKTKVKSTVKKTKSLPITSNTSPEPIATTPPKPMASVPSQKCLSNGKHESRSHPQNNSPDLAKLDTSNSKLHPLTTTPTSSVFGSPSSLPQQPMCQEKLQNNPRKYGKTPGRERKKNESIRKTAPKIQSYKGNAFQFTSPLTNSPSTFSPPWDTNKITFSNVVSQNPFTKPPMPNNNGLTTCKCILPEEQQHHLHKNSHMEKRSTFETLSSADPPILDSSSSTKKSYIDLGPIGSRKSPLSTPVWEPIPPIEKPIPTTTHNTLNGNSNSFFSGSFPSYYQTNSDLISSKTPISEMDLGGASGLLDNVYGQPSTGQNTPPSKRVWDSALLLTVLQQQQQQDNDLTNLSSMYTNSNNLWSSDKVWYQQGSPLIRPPPGLEPLREKISTTTIGNSMVEQQHQQQQQENSLPQFDPFSSLSSIWSTDQLTSNKNKTNTNNIGKQ